MPERPGAELHMRSHKYGRSPTVREFKQEPDAMEAYCLKCRTKREMKEPTPITMKNGKPATQGVCPECGTKMFKIGKATA